MPRVMKCAKAVFALVIGAALAGSAFAQETVPPPSPEDQAIAVEITEIFRDFCLTSFPDDAAVDATARTRSATALKPEEVPKYLKDDPGRGWRLKTALGLYVVTIEHPPVRACGVRRMTRLGLTSAAPFRDALQAFAARQGGVIAPGAMQKAAMGGVDLTAFPMQMSKDGRPTDQFLVILSNYHGRVPAEFAEDAKGGIGVEARLVRQLIP